MIGTHLAERYEILAELGRGGMGVVYKARDPVLARDVAIKLIPPGNLTQNAEERFLREAQIVAQMDHPAIVPIYDLGRHEGSVFFVMPILPGTNLRHLMREGSLRLGDVLDIGTQVAEALDYSHARGIVHRDIKPENVMTARDEMGHIRARVMDFGLALGSAEDRLTKTGTLVGTVTYFSPEQVTSKTFDGRTDIYALGTVLYECLANEPPYTGEVQTILYRIVHELPQSLRTLGADVSEELEAVIFQCLEKDPEKRPKRGAHLAEALRRYRSKLHEEEFTRSVMLTASRLVGRPAAAASPFIGRAKEVAELQRRLHASVAGECQFAMIAGEPGIGKTRLVEELTGLARARKIRVLSGRFVEQDRAFAHQGFCELIQDYFRSKDTGSSLTSRPDLSDLASDLISLFPVLSEIAELRAAASDSGTATTAKPEDKSVIFELIARTLTRLAQGKALVLVLEELHGAEQSIEALQYVVRRLAPTPTFIVGTYRQAAVDKRHPLAKMLESFRGDSRFVALTLGPFSPSDYRSLVETATGGSKVSDALAARLLDATDGNPLFTKELVRSLLDSGSIATDDSGVLNLSGGGLLSAGALPETIQQAVETRLERLPEEQREVLSVASVIGRSFEDRDIEALAEDADDVEDSVEKLLKGGLLEEHQDARGNRLAFASGILRDVLYGGLSRRNRKSLHRKYADLLEKRHAGRLERVYPELVHHFTQGDVKEKAVEYSLKLAEKSLDAFIADEASRVAKAALDFVEDEEWPGDKGLEGEARLLLARAAQMSGRADAALREAEIAVKVFEREKRPERAAAAIVFLAETAWHGRMVEETRRFVERGIPIAKDADHLQRLLSLGTTVASLRGEYQKAATYQAQLERLTAGEKRSTEELPRGGTLVAAMVNPVTVTEPALFRMAEENEVLSCVFETLLATDEEGNLVPLLCEEWRLAEEGRSTHLRLRRGVRFSDGTALTAADVKASLEHGVRVRSGGLHGALASIRGASEFKSGAAPEITGIRAVSDDRVEIDLVEPLPIFPALLTDTATAIVRVIPGTGAAAEAVIGTGPFRFARFTPERIVLERNPHWWKEPGARLDGIEFRTTMSASAIAYGLRDGSVDLGRDLPPQELDALLREPRFRAGLVETPKKGTYFAIFSTKGTVGGNRALRAALAGVTRSQDFVWGALGRFAVPATGVIPPGILGHDAGRRRALLSRESALEMLATSGLETPIRLEASVHPILQDRFRAVTSAILRVWRDVGVEVDIVTSTLAEHLDSQKRQDVDVLLGRWMADYDDPDDFTFSLFHSENGLYRTYFSSPEADQLIAQARSEPRAGAREALYRRFEQMLLDEAVLIPLFHEVDYRIAGPGVKALRLGSTPPFVSYAEIAKTAVAEEAPRELAGGVLHVPLAGIVQTLDPLFVTTVEAGDVVANVFETLTRDIGGARIVPWLAQEMRPESGLTRFRFRLRPGVRFHDGRALTARDVRFSFERVLGNPMSGARSLLAAIRGASRLLDGEHVPLDGFHIVSPLEFAIDLEKPVSFFPALLSYPGTSIVPEGTETVGGSWRDGCAGTGPFRVVTFEQGQIALERNPDYWREGYPKSEGLVFRTGVTPAEIKSEFLAGRFSIASDLLPEDAEALRADPRFRSGVREIPMLVTYFIVFNAHRGRMTDIRLRRSISDALDAAAIVRRTMPRLALAATGLIPPGLPGHSPTPRPRAAASQASRSTAKESIELTALVHPVLSGEFSLFTKELLQAFRDIGFKVRVVNETMGEYQEGRRKGESDLVIGRWIGDYADADTFVYLLHSREGPLGPYCASPQIDELAERGRAEIEPRIRHSIYREVEDTLARDALLVPLFHEQAYRIARPEVEGMSLGFSFPMVAYEELRIGR